MFHKLFKKQKRKSIDEFGRTPTFIALIENNTEGFKQSLEEINEINIVDNNGMSLLFFACVYNRIEMAKALIEKGIKIELKDSHGNTALWRAVFECKGKNYELVELLVSHGADINSENKMQQTPRKFAETICDEYLIRIMKI